MFGQKVCDLLNWILYLREHLNCLKCFLIPKPAVVRWSQQQIYLQVRFLTSFWPSQTRSLYAPSILICNFYSRMCYMVGLYCKPQLLRVVRFTVLVLNCSQLNFVEKSHHNGNKFPAATPYIAARGLCCYKHK